MQYTVMFCAIADSGLSMQLLLSQTTTGLMLPEVRNWTAEEEPLLTNVYWQLKTQYSIH